MIVVQIRKDGFKRVQFLTGWIHPSWTESTARELIDAAIELESEAFVRKHMCDIHDKWLSDGNSK